MLLFSDETQKHRVQGTAGSLSACRQDTDKAEPALRGARALGQRDEHRNSWETDRTGCQTGSPQYLQIPPSRELPSQALGGLGYNSHSPCRQIFQGFSQIQWHQFVHEESELVEPSLIFVAFGEFVFSFFFSVKI